MVLQFAPKIVIPPIMLQINLFSKLIPDFALLYNQLDCHPFPSTNGMLGALFADWATKPEPLTTMNKQYRVKTKITETSRDLVAL
jgi:hypothetical protein